MSPWTAEFFTLSKQTEGLEVEANMRGHQDDTLSSVIKTASSGTMVLWILCKYTFHTKDGLGKKTVLFTLHKCEQNTE